MARRAESPGFWRTAPGILTAFAGVITAIAGLVAVLSDAGVVGPDRRLDGDPGRIAAAEEVATGLRDSSALRTHVPDISGSWTAEVAYPWGVTVDETFDFSVEAGNVLGTASYLGVPRALLDPELRGDRLSFGTRVEEVLGEQSSSYENRYDGLITARGIQFRLHDSRGRGPIEFTMRRR